MVTIYEKESGKAVNFAHIIDAKESVAGGFYVWNNPTIVKGPEIPKAQKTIENEDDTSKVPKVSEGDAKPEVSKIDENIKKEKDVSVPAKKGRTFPKKPSKIKK